MHSTKVHAALVALSRPHNGGWFSASDIAAAVGATAHEVTECLGGPFHSDACDRPEWCVAGWTDLGFTVYSLRVQEAQA